jgi:hypothetical protein
MMMRPQEWQLLTETMTVFETGICCIWPQMIAQEDFIASCNIDISVQLICYVHFSSILYTIALPIFWFSSGWYYTFLPPHIFEKIKTKLKLKLHGAEPFLRSRQLHSYSRISQRIMEPEGSLLCSQGPSTGPYPEPDQFSSYHPILFL